jgi:hypothetical protein
MKKVTLQSMLVDYVKYRKQKDVKEKTVKAKNYETCRQNLSDIMTVLGVDVKYFKEKESIVSSKEAAYQFAEKDQDLLFDILDRYTSREFVLIRKGEFLMVPVESLTFYLEAFTTMLKHLEAGEEIIRALREEMMRHMQYELAVEMYATCHTMKGIEQDVQQLLAWDEELTYSDYVILTRDLNAQLQALRDRVRHVYIFMNDGRFQENMKAESAILRQRPETKDYIKKRVKLDQVLLKNERYAILNEQLERLNSKSDFMKKQLPQYDEILKEIAQISRETQLREFGEILKHEDYSGEDRSTLCIPSEEALKHAVRVYDELRACRSEVDPEEPLLADLLCAERFGHDTREKEPSK